MAELFSRFSFSTGGVDLNCLLECIENTSRDGYFISSNAVRRVFNRIAKDGQQLSFYEFLRFITVMSIKRFPHLGEAPALSRFINNLSYAFSIPFEEDEPNFQQHGVNHASSQQINSTIYFRPPSRSPMVHSSIGRTLSSSPIHTNYYDKASNQADVRSSQDLNVNRSRDASYPSSQTNQSSPNFHENTQSLPLQASFHNMNKRLYSSQQPFVSNLQSQQYHSNNNHHRSVSPPQLVVHHNLSSSPPPPSKSVGRPVREWPGWERVSPVRPRTTPSPPRMRPLPPHAIYPNTKHFSPCTPHLAQAARDRFNRCGPIPPPEQFPENISYSRPPPPSTTFISPPPQLVGAKRSSPPRVETDEADLPTVVHEPGLDRSLANVFDMLANPNTNLMDNSTFTKLIKKTGIASFDEPRIAMADVDVSFAQVKRQTAKGIDLPEFKEVLALIAWRARNPCTCGGRNAPSGAFLSNPNQIVHAVGCGREEGGVAYYRLANLILDIASDLKQRL